MPALAHNSQGISAQTEVDGMTEGDVARIARKDIPASGGGGVHQSKERDGGHGWIWEYLWEGDGNGQQRKQPERFEYPHCFLASNFPNNPCGRTSRTTTSSIKKTVLAQTGDHTTAVTSSITSIPTEAIRAPCKLPMPPKIMMASRREIRSYALLALKALVAPKAMPPAAASPMPMPKVIAETCSTLMPINSAEVRFCIEARRLKPN